MDLKNGNLNAQKYHHFTHLKKFPQIKNFVVTMDNKQEGTNQSVFRSNKTPNIIGSGRRRGHQHHVRNNGTRPSNIEADEILAALRSGDQMPITEPSLQHIDIDTNLDDDNFLEIEEQQSNYNDKYEDDTCKIQDKNTRKSRSDKNLMYDDHNDGDDDDDVDDDDSNKMTLSTNLESGAGASNNNISSQITLSDRSTNNSRNSDKSKTKRSKRGEATQSDIELNASRDISRKKFKRISPLEERPPLEGADSDYWTENSATDIENDPEAAEWSKLRCTSERTEVIAEREYRRQNRRCADYPGLAFGRSIFSSDTMMKLNIIRNELHNIMKTQLKRVRVVRTLVPRLRNRIHDQKRKIAIDLLPLFRYAYVHFWSTTPIDLSPIESYMFHCFHRRTQRAHAHTNGN